MAVTIAGNGLTTLCWLGSGMMAARLLGPTGRGELAAIQTWGGFISILAMMGMPDALVYFSAREPARAGAYTFSAIVLALLGCLPLLAIGYLAMPALLSAQSSTVVTEARIYLLLGFASAVGQVPLNALRGLGDFVVWNGLRIVGGLCSVVPLILAWALHHRTAVFVANFNLIIFGAVFAGIALLTVSFRIPGPYRLERKMWKPMMAFGLPSVVTVVPYSLNLRLDQMVMAVIFAPALLGLYVVAVAWAAIMSPLFQAISIVVFPHIASHTIRDKQVSALTGILRLGVPLAVVVAAGVALVTPWGLPLIFGRVFAAAEAPAVVLVFAGAILAINQMLEEGLRGLGSPKAAMWSELGGLVVTLTLLALLLKRMGIMGAAIASLLGYATVTIQLLYWTRELTGCTLSAILLPSGSEVAEVFYRARVCLKGRRRATAE
jgi:antigen flippase